MDHPVLVRPAPDGGLEIVLSGEVDYTNASTATAAIQKAIAEARPTSIVVDLGGVTFLDSSGISVLVIAHKAADAHAAGCTFRSPVPFVYEQLRLTGLVELFGIAPPAG